MQQPGVGRIVLYNLPEGETRAMLITRVFDDRTVNGRIFMDGPGDIRLRVGIIIGMDYYVAGVIRGKGPGQWMFYDD